MKVKLYERGHCCMLVPVHCPIKKTSCQTSTPTTLEVVNTRCAHLMRADIVNHVALCALEPSAINAAQKRPHHD